MDQLSSASDCYLNDQLWIQRCGPDLGNALFQLVRGVDEKGDQIKVIDTNLCVERTRTRLIVLGTCDESLMNQKWIGVDLSSPFVWHPSGQGDKCVSQHHHPKPGEVIYAETCYLAHYWNTSLWEAI